ncbi:hypothetical protein Tco_0928430, partial [Tanacetum coccineum]
PFIAMSVTTIASLKVGQEDCIIEAKVYRKWTSKSIPEMKDQAFCCILIDREVNKQKLKTSCLLQLLMRHGTPTHDIIEVIPTISHQMSETPPAEKDSTTGTTAARPRPDTAKRSLHTDLSLESKKKRD